MTKRIARLAVVSAAVAAFVLPATAASAEWCIIQEPTIGLYYCI